VRFTIEKLRTLILIAGVLLVVALGGFLAKSRLKKAFKLGELPERLGYNITADATGFTLDHGFGGHSRYRIHASKAVQYKDNNAILHDVLIELYGEDGSRVDRIEGAEFEYNKQSAKATATGPVSITLMRPEVAPAIAPNASTEKARKDKRTPISSVAQAAGRGEIHVKTSGLIFDTSNGVATTDQHVDFSMVQGSGSSLGATYDSKQGFLVLDKSVELTTRRGKDDVAIHAEHAEFERDSHLCRMHLATAHYRGGEARAGDAKVLFRDDGSAVRLDALNGFDLVTATGGHIAAPSGFMDFDDHNQPSHGHLEGGVKMDSSRPTEDGAGERRMRGSAPAADLDFTLAGQLRHVHMGRGVEMESQSVTQAGDGTERVNRTWNSPFADVDFQDSGHGRLQPKTLHGVQGVVVTGESQHGNGPAVPSRLAADEVTGQFGLNAELSSVIGVGHAAMEETTAAGTRQNVVGDRLEARFAPPTQSVTSLGPRNSAPKTQSSARDQIQSAVVDGHVFLTEQTATKPGSQPPAILRAWGGKASYDGVQDLLHLTLSPRVEDGGLQLTADKIDVARASADAFAHGNVKATWINAEAANAGSGPGRPTMGAGANIALGGKDPAHMIAAEAQLHQATGEAIFRGHARLWQDANSVAGPEIVLDRRKQTLTAHSSDPAEPVKAVLLSSDRPGSAASAQKQPSPLEASHGKKNAPSVISIRCGDLKYSNAERKAGMSGGALGSVVAETATASTTSNQVELILLPPGNHAGKDGGQAQVDRMTAQGNVIVTSGDRRGTGERLVYTGDTGDYVLTGTASDPPRMTDPLRGNVTGDTLIFHGRDDSVSIEGGAHRTTTEGTAPK
jgi:lipopolysaccharide export system protein LptA